jgi:hypothetical protein
MASNAGNYSIAGVANIHGGAGQFFLSNDVANLLFGNRGEAAASVAFDKSVEATLKASVPAVTTVGRRTATIISMNLKGVTGPAPALVGKTGAEVLGEWLSGIGELKLAADLAMTGSEAIGCSIHR